jgi:hypothetical protein
MRTKTLLLSATALVAGVVSSMAQSNVYSVNIVGYVNTPLPNGALTLVQNPLDNGTNTLNSVLGAVASGSSAYVWNGAGYTPASKPKAAWSPDLSIPTGLGFFVQRAGAVGTNTFVGQVLAGPGQSVTNQLAAGVLTLTGSKLPYADTLNGTNLGLNTAPSGSVVYKWNGAGYTPSSKPKAAWSPDLSISVGEAFFVQTPSGFTWVQSIPAN